MHKQDNDLFFTCSLIEFIARETHNQRFDIVDALGEDLIRIYEYADVFHCEPIAKVADDFITRNNIKNGGFDNISECKYKIPSYWEIGAVFERLIEDVCDDVILGIKEVYSSWLASEIFNFNSDLYYQSREYLRVCWVEGEILDE